MPVTASTVLGAAVTTNTVEDGDTNSEASSECTIVEPDEMVDILYLRFSMVARPFKLPEYPEVAFEVKKYFQDPATLLTWYRVGAEIIYIVELEKPVTKKGHSVTFRRGERTLTVDLYDYEPTYYQRRGKDNSMKGRSSVRRDDAILLTFYKAGHKDLKEVPKIQFDQ